MRRLGGSHDPLALFAQAADATGSLLLETADVLGEAPARSFLVPRSALVLRARGRVVTARALTAGGQRVLPWLARELALEGEVSEVDGGLEVAYPPLPAGDLRARLLAPGPLTALRALRRLQPRVSPDLCSHLIPCVFAYDLLGSLEDLPAPRARPLAGCGLGDDDYTAWLPDSMFAFDGRGAGRVFAYAYGGPEAERGVFDARARLEELVARAGERTPPFQAPGAPALERVEVAPGDERYAEWVCELKERILAGDVFQIVPSRTFRAPCPDPLGAYARLRLLNPSPYMFLVRDEGAVLFGASPETALRVGSGPRASVEIRPIAGTTRRGRDGAGELDLDLDGRLEVEMRLSEKEVAEHVMLIDLARNDVARVSRAGTRHVPRICGVDRYSHVSHLVSHVKGELDPRLDALHAYASSMNMGTLVGAPKVRAAQLLRELEPTRRGPYGGAVGYLAEDGSMDSAIVIRSALVAGGVAHVRAGAGVVYDSDPRAETEETTRKARAVLRALGAPEELALTAVDEVEPTEGSEAREGSPSPAPEPPARSAALPKAALGPSGEAPDSDGSVGGAEVPQPATPDAARVSVLFIDNVDSFTFNLVDEFARRGCDVQVWRNDLSAPDALALALSLPAPRLIVLSPGPGAPASAGCCVEVVRLAAGRVPLLGICLGHQAIVEAYGGRVERAPQVVHGKASSLEHDGSGPFAGLPSPLRVGRYHSLAAATLEGGLRANASVNGVVMGVLHPSGVAGLQFHPESVLTPLGGRLIENALTWARERAGEGL